MSFQGTQDRTSRGCILLTLRDVDTSERPFGIHSNTPRPLWSPSTARLSPHAPATTLHEVMIQKVFMEHARTHGFELPLGIDLPLPKCDSTDLRARPLQICERPQATDTPADA